MNAEPRASRDDDEALLQFLYLAPVGLVQASLQGEIAFMNPLSAQLLMPLSRDGGLTNLFTALEHVAPEVRNLVAHFAAERGSICDGLRIPLRADIKGRAGAQVLSLSLVKLDHVRLMAVLTDITQQVKRERLLRQNETWLNAILIGITDYAVLGLDAAGRVLKCGSGVERVTGFVPAAVIGRAYSLFYPDGAATPEELLDRLNEANDSGWSLDHGWHVRRDGSRYWASVMIARLHEPGDPSRPDEAAYCLIIRDLTAQRESREPHRLATTLRAGSAT